jgi:multidrug resistance efflux pump
MALATAELLAGDERMSDHVPHDEIPNPDLGDGPVEMCSPHYAPHAGHGTHHPPRVSGWLRRRLVVGFLAILGLAGAVAGAGMLTGFLPNPVVAGDPNASGRVDPRDAGIQPVKVVRPKREPNFRITTLIPVAKVEPYYRAGLRARVSGVVRSVTRDIGEPVRAGELLVEIDVPDLKQAVEQKGAIIVQREKELAAAGAELAVAKAATEAADVAIKVKELEVSRAKDTLAARKFDLDGITLLFKKQVVEKFRLESATLDYQAALLGVKAAEADVDKAKVDQAGKLASWEKAKADVDLKGALVEVARKDRDAAAIQYGYSRLYAPFDGVIVARSTDPGKDVFEGPGASEPLITIARTDLVTVVGKVPDNAAPFVSWDTEALVEFAQLPGVTVRGQITRFSQAIDPADQTMRVEVDVYNGPLSDYRAMLARAAVKSTVSPFIPFDRAAGLLAAGAGLIRSKADHKGWHEGSALTPNWGTDGPIRRIVPGTTATMRLNLENFTDTFLLPSGAVYNRAGQLYILVVEDGVTRQIPVHVQMNDGTLVKVATVIPAPGGQQATRALTGNEVIVATRQLEVGEGARVTPVFDKW